MYSCESWTLSVNMRKRIEAAEMWFIRRMLKIKWTEKKSNREVLEMAECERSLLNKIRKRKAKFMGHVMRRGGMENLVTTGKMLGKRTPGRQRLKMLDDTTAWMECGRNSDTIRQMYDRDVWRAKIANASRHGTG